MPCRHYSDEEIDAERDAVIHEQRALVDELTRMLCGLCKISKGLDISSVPGLWSWWKDHQKKDDARAKKERKKIEDKIAALDAEIQELRKKL